MIVVRFVMQAQPGKAQEMVSRLNDGADIMRRIAGPNAKVRLMTDLSGPFDTVVQEIDLESLAEWEQLRAKIFSDPEFLEAQAMSDSPAVSGRTEFFTLEAEY
jgi:hypothetical protein